MRNKLTWCKYRNSYYSILYTDNSINVINCLSTKRVQTETHSQFLLGTQWVIIMATTVQQAVRPLFRLFSITGLNIHLQEKVYLSIVFNLAIWIGYIYLTYYVVIACRLEEQYKDFNSLTITILLFLNCVTSVILSVLYDKVQTLIYYSKTTCLTFLHITFLHYLKTNIFIIYYCSHRDFGHLWRSLRL